MNLIFSTNNYNDSFFENKDHGLFLQKIHPLPVATSSHASQGRDWVNNAASQGRDWVNNAASQGRDWVNNAKAGVEAAISRTREGSRLRKNRLAALGL